MDSKITLSGTFQEFFNQKFAAFIVASITINGVEHVVEYYNCIDGHLQFTSTSNDQKRIIQIPLNQIAYVYEKDIDPSADPHYEDKVHDQPVVVIAKGNLPYFDIETFKKRIIQFY